MQPRIRWYVSRKNGYPIGGPYKSEADAQKNLDIFKGKFAEDLEIVSHDINTLRVTPTVLDDSDANPSYKNRHARRRAAAKARKDR
jgi:hypothetical protein